MSGTPATQNGPDHGSLRSYVTGFLLALVLTAVAFWLVMTAAAPTPILLVAILMLAAVQIVAHLRYFLHIDGSAEKRWTLVSLLLAILVVAIVVMGSLWVIRELNSHMMPWMTIVGG